MIAKLVYFVVLANVVWGGWMFWKGMNPDLKANFLLSTFLLLFAFYVWGRVLFRKRTLRE